MRESDEMTPDILSYWLERHKKDCMRLRYLMDMYEGQHPIHMLPAKKPWKPDNRIMVNFAKYIVDTFNGYFIGIPVKTMHPDSTVKAEMEQIEKYNDQDDNNAELSKICSVYGNGFEMLYTDEQSRMCDTYFTPLECFMIYDDSVARKPLYGVRYFIDVEGNTVGSVYTRSTEIRFSDGNGGISFLAEEPHYFSGVPMVEYIENEERQGIFEQEESAINAYEKALSEKANDVDYFADAYMLLLGLSLDEKELYNIRTDRVISAPPMDAEDLNAIRAEFLQKPSADTTQENLLNRLETQIFAMSMVANISDESFGGSSGTALAYKLQPMKNLAVLKARKFASGMNQRWKLIASHPATKMPEDAWEEITYQFTQNAPKNLLEEVQTAAQMSGITSKETQLSVISAVDDPQAELEKMDAENGTVPEDQYKAERVTNEQEQ